MCLLDIVRSDIKADTKRSDDNYAEYRKCQRYTQPKAALKPGHVK
jgi:hypothetical protein